MTELAGKVAIVTGASRRRGLGRALAFGLAEAGADVVVTAAPNSEVRLRPDEREAGWHGLPSVVEEILKCGVRGVGVTVDITSSSDVEHLISEAVRVCGRLDILVNNAAYPRAADRVPLTELPESTWRSIIDVNLTGTMLCCKHAARRLIEQKQGGSIVSISSIAALTAQETFSAYAASKAAIHALNGSLAEELGPYGITCNVVAPGFLDTSRIDVLREGGRWEKRLSTIPLKRAGAPEEVAQLVRFLCGPHARWISGEVFVIAGGEIRRTAR